MAEEDIQAEEEKDGDDIDELLNSFDLEEEPKEEPKEDIDAKIAKAINDNPTIQGFAQAQTDTAVKSTISEMKGMDARLGDVEDDVLEAMLNHSAYKDKRVLNAFQNRHQRPGEWNKVLKSLASGYAEKFIKEKDDDTTASRDAVRNAVSGQSPSLPGEESEEDYDRKVALMSDAEFDNFKKELRRAERDAARAR